MSDTKLNCPACQATNKIPSERLGDKPKCGKCKKPLFTGRAMNLTGQNLNATLVNNDIPVIVDCWAPWCGPCKSFAPTFEKAASELEPNFRLAKLNTEKEQRIAQKWNIRSIPTLILLKNGKEVKRSSGAMNLTQLKAWANS